MIKGGLFPTFILCLLASSCAGPTTPFGALNIFAKKVRPVSKEGHPWFQDIHIKFVPPRQKWHQSSKVKMVLEDPWGIEKTPHIKVLYDGIDVTTDFLDLTKIKKEQNKIVYDIDSIRFLPSRDNRLEVQYFRTGINIPVKSFSWASPNCSLHSIDQINMDEFNSSKKPIVRSIASLSSRSGINPNFMAGLVAQESSFNPKAVSWAKAIGLTQITPLAEAEIQGSLENWPKYPKLNKFPAPFIKALIRKNKITSENEWRLNVDKSITGGIHYLKYLEDYWGKQNVSPMINYTDLILASYNSGATRVKRAIHKNGHNWLKSENLREARKYVGNIKSFCTEYTVKDKQ